MDVQAYSERAVNRVLFPDALPPPLWKKLHERVPFILGLDRSGKKGDADSRLRAIADAINALWIATPPEGFSIKEAKDGFDAILENYGDVIGQKVIVVSQEVWKKGDDYDVFKAGAFAIHQDNLRVQYEPCIVIRPTENKEAVLLKRLHAHNELKKIGSFRSAALPRKVFTSVSGEAADEPLSLIQKRYLADFSSLVKNEKIPCQLDRLTILISVPFNIKVNLLINVADSLRNLHSRGFIYGNVSPLNLLIDLVEGNFEVVINNFNFTTRPGRDDTVFEEKKVSPYWDTMTLEGWFLPFTDIYGLVMTIAEVLLPGVALGEGKNLSGLSENGLFLIQRYIKEYRETDLDSMSHLLEIRGISDFEKILETSSQDVSDIEKMWAIIKVVLDLVKTVKRQEKVLQERIGSSMGAYIPLSRMQDKSKDRVVKLFQSCNGFLSFEGIATKLESFYTAYISK